MLPGSFRPDGQYDWRVAWSRGRLRDHVRTRAPATSFDPRRHMPRHEHPGPQIKGEDLARRLDAVGQPRHNACIAGTWPTCPGPWKAS
jgi:hypothetical protein